MRVNVFFTAQDEWKRAINGIDAPIDMRSVIGLRGRAICALKSSQHLYYALAKPIYYAALAVIATISVVTLLHQKRNQQAKEHGLIVLNLLGRAFITPVTELILAIRAAAAVLYLKAYYTFSSFTLLRQEANRLLNPGDFQTFSNFLEGVRHRKEIGLDMRASKNFYEELDQELDRIATTLAAKDSTGKLRVSDNKKQRSLHRLTDVIKNNPYSPALVLSECQKQRSSLRAAPCTLDWAGLAADNFKNEILRDMAGQGRNGQIAEISQILADTIGISRATTGGRAYSYYCDPARKKQLLQAFYSRYTADSLCAYIQRHSSEWGGPDTLAAEQARQMCVGQLAALATQLAALDNLYGASWLDTTTAILKQEAARLYATIPRQSPEIQARYRETLQDFNSFIDRINNKYTPSYSGRALDTITQKMKQDLKDIATEFKALNPNNTAKIDDDKKKEVILELTKASKNCGPRWAEECERQKMAIHEPVNAEELMPYFFLRMKNEVIYDIISRPVHSGGLDQHTNDANTIRCAIGAEIRVDISLARLDEYARTPANAGRRHSYIRACTEDEKKAYIKHFFKRYTPERILTQLTTWINPEKREDLRGKLQGLLRDNYEKRYEDEDGCEYIMDHYMVKDEFGQIKHQLFNEAGIIALCGEEMSYAAAKILDLKGQYGDNFFDDPILPYSHYL